MIVLGSDGFIFEFIREWLLIELVNKLFVGDILKIIIRSGYLIMIRSGYLIISRSGYLSICIIKIRYMICWNI